MRREWDSRFCKEAIVLMLGPDTEWTSQICYFGDLEATLRLWSKDGWRVYAITLAFLNEFDLVHQIIFYKDPDAEEV